MGLRSAFKKHSYGKKAFKLAAEGNFRDALPLIDKGGDINYEANYTFVRQPLGLIASNCNVGFIALEKNNIPALEGLLQRGLDPNAVIDKKPDWPLLRSAILLSTQQAVDLLVKAGARMDVTLENMKTMREFAGENGIKLPPAQPSKNSQPGHKL